MHSESERLKDTQASKKTTKQAEHPAEAPGQPPLKPGKKPQLRHTKRHAQGTGLTGKPSESDLKQTGRSINP